MKKTFKVRLYPNRAQEQELLKILGASRFVYNYFLASRLGYYSEFDKTLSYKHMSRDLTQIRRHTWLQDVQLEPLSQSLRRLDKTYGFFFRRKTGFPKFKSKKASRQSFQKAVNWRLRGNRVQIQSGLFVKYRGRIDADAWSPVRPRW